MSKDTSSSATSPPNRRGTPSTSRTFLVTEVSGTRFLLVIERALFERFDLLIHPPRLNGTPRRQQPLGTEDREQHQRKPEHQHPEVRELAESLGQVGDEERTDHHAPPVPLAADDDRCQEEDGEEQQEGLGVDEALPAGVQGPRQTADERARREGEKLRSEERRVGK